MNQKLLSWVVVIVFVLTACAQTQADEQEALVEVETTVPENVPESSRSAVFQQIEDDVRARDDDAATFSAASVGQILTINAQAQTGAPGRARLDLLPEATILRMGPNTLFTVEELSMEGNDPLTRLRLTAGQVWIILLGGSLEVETPNGIAGVRGSFMGVNYDAEKMSMSTTCLEGTCDLSNDLGRTDLATGEAADIPGANQPPSSSRPLTTDEQVGWLWNNPEAAPHLGPIYETVKITKDDGTSLAGTYYFASQQTNWVMVLDPMVVGTQEDWTQFGVLDWLLGQPGPLEEAWGTTPAVPLNVFTYDPTGQGLSDGDPETFHADAWQEDARVTADFSRDFLSGFPSVYNPHPTCQIFVGASTGADRAMLACAASPQSCMGVAALSPGGYLGVDFAAAYESYRNGTLIGYSMEGNMDTACPGLDPEVGAQVLCVASTDDTHSASTCQSISDLYYATNLFAGQGHGTSYFMDPSVSGSFGELFSGFISSVVNP